MTCAHCACMLRSEALIGHFQRLKTASYTGSNQVQAINHGVGVTSVPPDTNGVFTRAACVNRRDSSPTESSLRSVEADQIDTIKNDAALVSSLDRQEIAEFGATSTTQAAGVSSISLFIDLNTVEKTYQYSVICF